MVEGNICSTAMVRKSGVPRCPRTQGRTYVLCRDLRGLLAAQRFGRGRQSQGESRAEDARQGEVRCDDKSYEAGEQSVGAHVAELVEQSVAPKGKPRSPARTGHRAGFCVPHGVDRLRLRVGLPTC